MMECHQLMSLTLEDLCAELWLTHVDLAFKQRGAAPVAAQGAVRSGACFVRFSCSVSR